MFDKYQIAANVTLEDLENFKGKLPAEKQRQIFGRNIFGKKTINIDTTNQGRVFGKFVVCFGTDCCHFDFSFEEIADLANNPQKIIHF